MRIAARLLLAMTVRTLQWIVSVARLEKYRQKRNFARTPEPSGRQHKRGAEGGLFVVHKHAARRLHYDLRLEHDGVLESWAVPKGPSLEPGEKRLAVHVEDHPLEYGDFEGTIPAHEYGGGTVMLWDRGRWRPTRRTEGRIDFELEGERLRGRWTLTRMKNRDDGRENWLLIKRHDAEPVPAAEPLPEDRSVISGRSMAEIADGAPPAAPAKRRRKPAGRARRRSADDAEPLPTAPRPQLATLADAAPAGDHWLHEIKFDGYRILARLDRGSVQLISRNGKDWTGRFPEVAERLQALPVATALLDGEVVATAADGTSSFRALQEALSQRRTGGLSYQLFDLLHLEGRDLSQTPLLERKAALRQLMDSFDGGREIRYTDHVIGEGPSFFEHACRLGLEGVVSKRVSAPYRAERNRHWLKVKCTHHEELVVGGYTEPGGSRSGFGALLLGAFDPAGALVYAGKVGTGFDQRSLANITRTLKKLETEQCPFAACPEKRGVRWVRPELVAEVEFTEWTRDGVLRHPSFRGLREDRSPEEIRMPAPRQTNAPTADANDDRVAGVRLSNPDRVLYPEQGLTKIALARFYEEIAEHILPLLRRRPLALVRCPQGRGGQCFFQKHPGQAMPGDMPRIAIREKEGKADYLYVDDLHDLVGLVQAGTLELHVWGSRVEDHEHPDMLVFDLDPGGDVAWSTVIEVARSLRDRLDHLGLESFCRTTGGKGLHVVVPLTPSLGWDAVKAFTRGVAEAHARDDRTRLTVNMSKSKRGGRIFLDYLRNGRGATAIASYSTRAREGAPVAVPIRWNELNAALVSDRYNVRNLRRRLAALRGDPWAEFEDARRPLTAAMLHAVGADAGKRR